MILIISPLTDVFTTIGASVDALAFSLTVAKLSSVDYAIRPLEHSLTVEFAIFPVADVAAIVRILLLALTVPFVLEPLPFVSCTI